MHIVHLEAGRHLYGGARQVLLLMRGLRVRGVGCTLVCPASSAVAEDATRSGLVVQPVPMLGDLDPFFVFRFRKLLAALGPDLVHVHSRRGADWLGGIAARGRRIPAILTRRVDRPESRIVATLRYRHYARVVAISAAIRHQLERAGVPADRLVLIRSAADAALVEPAWSRDRLSREFGLDPGHRLVACVAQLIPRKGHELLLHAWPQIRAACPEARLLLFGQGPLEGALRRRIRRMGLRDCVVLAGFRADLPAFLGRVDLLVHPALQEGLGLAVLEAQAAGVPVVAFQAGGIAEVVLNGETGLLVPPGDTAALATAVAGLLQNEARRRALGEAAWRRVGQHFRVADMVESHLTLYRSVLETWRRDGH